MEHEISKAIEKIQAGEIESAERILLKINDRQAGIPNVLHMLGYIALETDRSKTAVKHLSQAIKSISHDASLFNLLGCAHRNEGNVDDAIEAFSKAVSLDPELANARFNLANALFKAGLFEEAAIEFRCTVELTPDDAVAHDNLGNTLQRLGKSNEAVASYRKALAIKPDYAVAHNNLGNTLHKLGKFNEAVASYRKALAIKPDYAEAHFNLGDLQLLTGNFQDGWENYAWRWQVEYLGLRPREYKKPFWDGSALKGKTLFVYPEQGLGDTIQFVRYLPLVAALGGRVVFLVPKPLIRLFQGTEFGADLLAPGDPLPQFDCHTPLLELPRLLNTAQESVPADIPYLLAESDRVEQWKERIGGRGLRIGIAWQGNPSTVLDKGRSLPLTAFSKIADVQGSRLISMQKDHGLEQLQDLPAGMAVEVLGDDFDAGGDAFIDTAAVMMSLDLVITSDTSIAHLAGALGRPVWIALKFCPDWRWMLERGDSPWYPTMRLFRQTIAGDWDGVFEEIGKALQDQFIRDS